MSEIHGDQRDGFSKREEQRDGFSILREGQCDGLMEIREFRADRFDQTPKRKTCKQRDEMTSASRSNKFDVLNFTELPLEVEDVKAVDVVQEIVEITVDSGTAKSV